MAIPSASQIATTQNYVSSTNFLSTAFAPHKPEVSDDFIKRYGSQNLTGFLDMIGAKAPVSNFTFYHYEEDWIHQSFKADDTAADVALTGGVQILIDATSHLASDSAAGATSFVRPGSVILFPTGEVGLCVAKWTSNQSAANETLDGYAGTLQSGPTPGVNNHVIHVMNYKQSMV
jgi:hypothetical protein